jgi:hypothetical protein
MTAEEVVISKTFIFEITGGFSPCPFVKKAKPIIERKNNKQKRKGLIFIIFYFPIIEKIFYNEKMARVLSQIYLISAISEAEKKRKNC